MAWTLAQPGNEDIRSADAPVGETNEGALNDMPLLPFRRECVPAVLRSAVEAPVAEGSVGAGAGTTAFSWKGGIGTDSSRSVLPRLTGSIRGECLDHMIAANEGSLRRQIASPLEYYHSSRGHLSLGKDAPDGRLIEPPELGRVVAVPMVGGPHHRYERRAA